ncbi:Zinc finger C2H2-type/integrase [Pacmanvirus A23]|uniref:Zinc finger C2H2-type/integrase n=1 Tax=Pacmanvirus A23 TaxID=1932881 RepID=UPI000A095D3F|nr:Zinc finger C2H2-type/integrase [Pacmanvirus A23]SIP85899.1 Zinc finger C2H2-type/integrase [Pacmanvirus A23]
MEHIDNKCYNCGKIFKKPSDFERHKNRKTPCLIREVPPEQIHNPNRCIFCNKIFSKKENLTRHLKTCKIKNGGMDVLVDKVKYDQEIRILKEQMELKDKKEKENEEKIQKLMEKVDALEKAVVTPQVIYNAPQNVTNNVNNVNNVNTINITINNYLKPSIQGLTITADEITTADKIPKLLLQKLYFNPELPENHCMYLQNKKDKTMILYDGGKWKSVTGENTKNVIYDLNNVINGDTGFQLINGKPGPYSGLDANFGKLQPNCINKIIGFNTDTDQKELSPDDAYEVFLGGRDIVLTTIKAAGCKLV